MFEPTGSFGVPVAEPSNIRFEYVKKLDAEFITAANPAVVADIIKRLQIAEAMNAMNLPKLERQPGSFIIPTVNEERMKSREGTLKDMGPR
ncbi:hypothetical protein A9R10_00035 [Aeromonas piscicola]|nr:hypothetical protein A9R10_00035 [Aeromonas piscicola]